MLKSLDTLVEDIGDVLGGQHPPDHSSVAEWGAELAAILSRALDRGVDSRRLRMSKIGRPCDRAAWYDAKGFPGEPLSNSTKLKFLFGHIIESLVLFLAATAGHTVERRQELVEVDGVRGSIDAVIDGVLVDVKSMSSFGFSKMEREGLGKDPFGYQAQISGYRVGLGSTVSEAAFVAVDKQHGHVGLFEADTSYPVRERIAHLKAVVASDTVPPRGFSDEPHGLSGNRKLGISCSYCPMKTECWPGLRTFLYSDGPKFLTHVKVVPKVHEATGG